MSRIDKVISSILLALVLAFVVAIVVYVPAYAIAEASCLEKGYPSYSLTWDLRTFCKSLDGSVTVSVQEIP